MKKRGFSCLLILTLLLGCLAPGAAFAKAKQMEDGVPVWTEETVKQYALDYIDGMEMSRLWGYYDLQIRRYMPLNAYEEFLTNLEWMTGAFQQFGSYRCERDDELEQKTHVLHLCMEKQDLDLYFTHKDREDDWEVMAIQFVPAEEEPLDPAAAVRNEENRLVETEVVFGTEDYPLSGTLTLPEWADRDNPVPVCVLIHDAGPMDRDETTGSVKLFADLASGLGKMGIGTLRYDKRTYTYGEDPEWTAEEETVQDAVLAGKLVRDMEGVDASRIIAAGHGLGGALAPRVVAEAEDVFSAILMMSSSALPYEEYLLKHSMLVGYTAQELEEARNTVRDLGETSEEEARGRTLFGRNAYYFWEMRQNDAVSLIKRLKLPTYIVQGKKDPLVPEDEGWREYSDQIGDVNYVSFHAFRALNHVLMTDLSTDEYGVPQYPAAVHLERTTSRNLAQWILGLNQKTAEE